MGGWGAEESFSKCTVLYGFTYDYLHSHVILIPDSFLSPCSHPSGCYGVAYGRGPSPQVSIIQSFIRNMMNLISGQWN